MTWADWVALSLQVVASAAAAAAAIAAWLTVKRARDERELEFRQRASDELKRLHGLIVDMASDFRSRIGQSVRTQWQIRAELRVVRVALPACVELATAPIPGTDVMRFDALFRAALAEVEAAQERIWFGEIADHGEFVENQPL